MFFVTMPGYSATIPITQYHLKCFDRSYHYARKDVQRRTLVVNNFSRSWSVRFSRYIAVSSRVGVAIGDGFGFC